MSAPAAEPDSEPMHDFAFSREWQDHKRLCGACGMKYEEGSHNDVRPLKPYTSYICPSGGGYGHSSAWSGAQDVPELRYARDAFCMCGRRYVEEGAETWRLSWEMRTPDMPTFRPMSRVQNEHAARRQMEGLRMIEAESGDVRNIRLVELVEVAS